MKIIELKLKDYPYKSRRGLSERIVKKRLEGKGFEVFRGRHILGKAGSINYHLYPNVRKKRDRLEHIMEETLGISLGYFRRLMRKAGGIPDFFCYRKIFWGREPEMFFAEVKLEHECIRPHQLWCMGLIEAYGMDAVVYRLKSRIFRKESEIELSGDVETNKKLKNRKILVRQEKLRLNY